MYYNRVIGLTGVGDFEDERLGDGSFDGLLRLDARRLLALTHTQLTRSLQVATRSLGGGEL